MVEQEVDLRPYFRALRRYWLLILLCGLLFGLLGYTASQVTEERYQATALIAVTEPRQLIEFDPRFEDVTPRTQLVRALPELARSDEIMESLLAELPTGTVDDRLALNRMLRAEPGEDANLIRLIVTHADPELAATVANTWADLFIERLNRLYGTQSADTFSFYETQKQAAAEAVAAAEQALVDFQGRNNFLLLDGQLTALQESQTALLAKRRNIDIAQSDIDALLALLRQSSEPTVTYTDQLTMLSVQLKAFSLEGYVPFLLTNEAGGPLSVQDRTAQIAAMDRLQQTLTDLAAQTDQALAALEPDLLAVQQAREAIDREGRQLVRERDVAVETYTTLARRVDEERVTSQDTTVGVSLISAAARPAQPESSGALRNTAIGLFLGGLIGVALALALAYRRKLIP